MPGNRARPVRRGAVGKGPAPLAPRRRPTLRARPVRRGAVGKGPAPLAPRRRPTLRHVRFGGGPWEKGLHCRYLASGLPDPKADGRLRPLGIATLEDKILQRAVVEVLNAIYEVDFRGFSYGFVCPEQGRELDVGRASRLGAVRTMEVGPLEPPCGGRFQTTHCCVS